MIRLTCSRVRRDLGAYHDGELAVSHQIAMAAHVESCQACAAELADLRLVRSALRQGAPGQAGLTPDEAAGFRTGVVSRANAERGVSLVVQIRDMFQDMHFVYAGCGGVVALIACAAVMLGMLRFAMSERPDSLAAMVAFLATPGSTVNALSVDPASQARWTATVDPASHARWTARVQASATQSAAQKEQEAVFDLAAAITGGGDGRITDLERLRARRRPLDAQEARHIEELMNAVSHARFDPAQGTVDRAATGTIWWLHAQTTVRASSSTRPGEFPAPARRGRSTLLRLSSAPLTIC